MKTLNETNMLISLPAGKAGVFLACSVMLVLPLASGAAEAKGGFPVSLPESATVLKQDINTARERELLRYKTIEKDIDKTVRQAIVYYKNSDFEKAIDLYLDAKKKLESLRKDMLSLEGLDAAGVSKYVSGHMNEKRVQKIEKRIESCNEQISRSYYYWAQAIYFEAEKSAKASDFTKAIEKCRRAYEVYPACKDEMEKMIARYELLREKAAEKAAFEEKTSNEDTVRKKNILIRQGEVLYSAGRWDQARSKFEQVIAIDPYNEYSINFLRKINIKLSEAGRRRMDLIHSERIAEAGWGALTPIIAYDESDSAGLVSEEGVEKTTAKSPLQEKLDSIKIPQIDFPDSPLSAVINTLIGYSKDYDTDPERKGINIIALGRFNPTMNSDNMEEGGTGNENEAKKNAAPASNDPTVTLTYFNEISLGDAIKRVCESIKASYKINNEDGVVEIAPSAEELEDTLKTEYFKLEATLDAEKLTDNKDLHDTYFSTVPRPEGAHTAFDPVAGRLIVTNTRENIEEMRKIFEKFNRPKPQILIQAKFVDVIMNDLEELGFQYTFSRENANVAYADAGTLKEFVYTGTESMTFGKNVNIYSKDEKNPDNNWYQYFTTTNTLPYKTADGTMVNPNTGQLVGTGENKTTNVTYYYKDSPLSNSSVTWGRNSKLTRVYDRAGTPTLDVDNETNFGKMWEFDAFTNKGYGLNAQVYALDQAGASDMLYCPRITTMDGRSATLDMVITKHYPEEWEEPEITTMDNMPILIGSTPELEEEEEGIFFQVTPQLDATEDPNFETITLQFDQLKVKKFAGWDDYSYQLPTDDGTGNYVNVPNIVRTPIFQEREIDTSIQCTDNSTVVIGGMITDESDIINDKYPILGDIPLIGRLFQSKGKRTYKSNLLIFITCRLVCPDGSPFGSREDVGTLTFKH